MIKPIGIAVAFVATVVFAGAADARDKPSADAGRTTRFPSPAPAGDVRVSGELGQRLHASYDRLEQDDYQPPELYDKPNEGWPGDKEGRTMLGLIQLAQATGRMPQHLQAILEMYPQRVNGKGYLGPVMTPAAISEQALGGQFWVLRSFYEYAAWRGDSRVLRWAEQLLNGVYLSAAGAYRHYPIDPSARAHGEFVFGREIGQSGRWVLSTDIGCGLAGSLDGLTDAYARQPTTQIESAIEEAIARFLAMDLEGVKAQLHSTLISTRSLLRHYGTTGRAELLQAAINRYQLYRTRAMTDNFENHNWFGRPEWTEGCAVVDSFLVAVQLWRFTQEPGYLEDAHRIYYNGLCVNQRSNGGFGCNSCASRDNPFLTVKTQEAYWCCTQRGADGLSNAARFCFFTDPQGVFVPFYHDAEADLQWPDAALEIRVKTDYPWQGKVRLDVVACSGERPLAIRLFVPSWAQAPSLKVNGEPIRAVVRAGFISVQRPWRPGEVVELSFDQQVIAKPPINLANGADQGEYHTYHYGPMLLGCSTSEPVQLDTSAQFVRQSRRAFTVQGRDLTLEPVYHLLNPAVSIDKHYRKQILFRAR